MNDLDLELQADLDRWYPPLAGAPDWAAVLARAGTTRPRRRSRPLLVGVGAALAIAVALVFAVSLSRNGVGFGQKALAAIGSGRYIDVELRPVTSPAATIVLATGQVDPVTPRIAIAYDTRTGTTLGRTTFAGVVFGGGGTSDPFVRDFAGGYQRALASGAARLVGQVVVDGVHAHVIRFATTSESDGITFREDVAVSDATHKPIQVRYASVDAHDRPYPGGMTFRVVHFGSAGSRPALPRVSAGFEHFSNSPSTTGNASDIRDVSIGEASDALGHGAVWPGAHVAGATLKRARLQFVTTYLLSGFRMRSHASGLRLDYRSGESRLVVEETTSPERGYGFWTGVYGTSGPLPAEGRAIMSCDIIDSTSGHGCVWQAQLRRDGVFVTIRSLERDLVIAAASRLVPTPSR